MRPERNKESGYKKLNRMMNKSFLYKGIEITVRSYELDETRAILIFTDKKDPIKITDLNKFIDACMPVSTPGKNEQSQVKSTQDQNSRETESSSSELLKANAGSVDLLKKLKHTLVQNIQTVKNDKKYVKQANAINSSASALIDVAKVQLVIGKIKSRQ